jgi:hypothetical protein
MALDFSASNFKEIQFSLHFLRFERVHGDVQACVLAISLSAQYAKGQSGER